MKTKKLATLMIVTFLLTITLVTPVFAKKTKTITIKKDTLYEQDKSDLDKVAIPVKIGTYTLKNKLKTGATTLKFVVPSDGTYIFTLSDYKKNTSGDGIVCVEFDKTHEPIAPDKVIGKVLLKTKGGKSNILWVSNKNNMSPYSDVINRGYKKRTGTVKLKKGQEIYIKAYGGTYTKSYKLNIKKK